MFFESPFSRSIVLQQFLPKSHPLNPFICMELLLLFYDKLPPQQVGGHLRGILLITFCIPLLSKLRSILRWFFEEVAPPHYIRPAH